MTTTNAKMEWKTAQKFGGGQKVVFDYKSLTLAELETAVADLGEKKYRAKQFFEWMHKHLAGDFDEMTNLPKKFRKTLDENGALTTLETETVQISQIDGTRKYLFRLGTNGEAADAANDKANEVAGDGDGAEYVESVLMQYEHGLSVCVSSQVGCRMGCKFCASTLNGLSRNLTAAEMLEQVYQIQKALQNEVRQTATNKTRNAENGSARISHIVVMGTGEPLDNFDNVIRFIELLSDENGLNISKRNITVSTCGIVPKIRKLQELDLPITLAISLHAPTQRKREALMPIAKTYEIHDLIDACKDYFEATGRRITFEYSLVKGQNDSENDAKELAKLLKKINCHVNLIPVNPVTERSLREPRKETVNAFKKELEKNGINATIRRELGRDIDGACGQLRRRYTK